jgi:hypothetical protein
MAVRGAYCYFCGALLDTQPPASAADRMALSASKEASLLPPIRIPFCHRGLQRLPEQSVLIDFHVRAS